MGQELGSCSGGGGGGGGDMREKRGPEMGCGVRGAAGAIEMHRAGTRIAMVY